MINGLLNEKYEIFLFFKFHTLFHSLTPKKYDGALYHSEGLEINYFLVYHMSRYLYISKDMIVLIQEAKITCSPPLSNLNRIFLLKGLMEFQII